MWMPPHTTVPPFATAARAAGTSSPAGAKMIAASSSSGAGCELLYRHFLGVPGRILCFGFSGIGHKVSDPFYPCFPRYYAHSPNQLTMAPAAEIDSTSDGLQLT